MKKGIIFLMMLAGALSASAQTTFNQGDMVINLGVGLGNALYSGAEYRTRIPPLAASLEYCIKDKLFDDNSALGIAAYAALSTAGYSVNVNGNSTANYNSSSVVLGGRGLFHYQFVDHLDTYTGFTVGWNGITTSKAGELLPNSKASEMLFDWVVGGRYYFTNNFAGMAELGFGVAYLTVGVSFRF